MVAAKPGSSAVPVIEPDARARWEREGSIRPVPVISVGNIAHGGRGKTPLVAHLARLLRAHGERPAILTRGYHRRRREDGVVVVSDGHSLLADLDRSGDEPLMLAESLPGVSVLVSETRVVAAALAERAFGATVHILDDGFQHRALARDIDLALVSPEDFGDRRVPFGRLRESPAALGRADAVILDAPSEIPWPGDNRLSAVRQRFRLTRTLGSPVPVDAAPVLDRSTPIVAVAGLASPERFRWLLETDGWTVARFVTFRDHHRFTASDIAAIVAAAREARAQAVVTTAKDAMRLRPFGAFPVPLVVLPLAVTVEPAETFEAWMLGRLAGARKARA